MFHHNVCRFRFHVILAAISLTALFILIRQPSTFLLTSAQINAFRSFRKLSESSSELREFLQEGLRDMIFLGHKETDICKQTQPTFRNQEWPSFKVLPGDLFTEAYLHSAFDDDRLAKDVFHRKNFEKEEFEKQLAYLPGRKFVRISTLMAVNSSVFDQYNRLVEESRKPNSTVKEPPLYSIYPEIYCAFTWQNDSTQSIVVKGGMTPTSFIGGYCTFLLSCPYSSRLPMPAFVSISRFSCNETSDQNVAAVLPVIVPPKKPREQSVSISVCIKGTEYAIDHSLKLIEWLEIHRILGARHVDIAVYYIHPNIRLVLEHYSKLGFVSTHNLPLPGSLPKDQKGMRRWHDTDIGGYTRVETMNYVECLYRYLQLDDYIVICDLDEILVPLKHQSWQNFLQDLENREPSSIWNAASYYLQNAFVFDQLSPDPAYPPYTHFLSHNARTPELGVAMGKSFQRVKNILFPNHHTLPANAVLRNDSASVHIGTEEALSLHYKSVKSVMAYYGGTEGKWLNNSVKYSMITQFSDTLISRVQETLQILRLNVSGILDSRSSSQTTG